MCDLMITILPTISSSWKCDEGQPNFILQLYSSMDFGRKWQLVHDNVMPGRFYWYDYMAPIFELLHKDTDCNLHNESVYDALLCQKDPATACQKRILPVENLFLTSLHNA